MVTDNNMVNILHGSTVQSIFHDQQWKFKINAAVGCVLMNHSESLTRYFHASPNNDRLFENPKLIESSEDFDSFLNELQSNDIIENVTKKRPDTSWSLHQITNITFYVYPIQLHAIGHYMSLPDHIRNNKAIIAGDKDSNGRFYINNHVYSEQWLS